MAALTPTITNTEYAGEKQRLTISVSPSSAVDTIDLSSYCSSIDGAVCTMTAGVDANLGPTQLSITGSTSLVLRTFNFSGTSATDWTGAAAKIQAVVNL